MIGRRVEQLYPERPTGTGEVLLEVRGMRRLPAVRDGVADRCTPARSSASAAWSAPAAASCCA